MARELLIERTAGKLAPVQARRLLRRMIAKANRNELLAVRSAEVKAIGRRLIAERLLLQAHDREHGLDHGLVHLGEGILLFPRVSLAATGQIGDVERRGVLGVGAAQHVGVGVVAEQVRHVAADVRKVGDGAIVHKGVPAKDEGVAVDLRDDAAARRADVREQAVRLRVGAQAAEVEVVDGRRLGFVEGRAGAVDALDVVGRGLGVPGHAEAVHVEEAVAHLHERVRRVLELGFFAVGEELGEVVFRALLGDGVGRVDQHVGEQAWLDGGDVCEPAAHGWGRSGFLVVYPKGLDI